MSDAKHDTDPHEGEDEAASSVNRLLSRFGPVPAIDPTREPPGPKRSEDGSLERPRPTPQSPQTPERARLFNDPHDDVFGDTMVRVGAQTIADDASFVPPTADAHVPLEVIDRRDWVRVPRRSGSAFRLLVVVFVIGIGSAFVFGRVTSWYDDQLDPPGEPGPALEDGFEISSGAASSEVTQNLYAAGVISNPTLFRYWLRDNHSAEFQAGDYVCLEENMSFEETVACLDDGPVPPSLFSVTIPEGLTLDAMIDTLASYGFEKQALRVNLGHALVTADLEGVPDPPLTDTPDKTGSGKEGLLFPDTYQVDLGDKDSDTVARDILALMANEMEDRFETAAAEGTDIVIDELGLTQYEVLTIASLVEKEAQLPQDRPRIARVIYNRLLDGTPLGIDATACYAAQVSCQDLTVENLENPSEWNTRAPGNIGLPPTPIAAPGESSIAAALRPEGGEWRYYVRTGANGEHTFTETYDEFLSAKAVCEAEGFC